MNIEEKDKKYQKIVHKVEDIFDRILKVFYIILLLIGVYFIVDTLLFYNKQSDITAQKPDIINEDTLKDISGNCIGWITMKDSEIDFPIMQGKTNTEYLNVNPYGEYSLAGSIFLDSRNKEDFSDQFNIVYGHHMENYYMFGALDHWSEKDYFNSHQYGNIDTKKGKKLKLKVFAFLYCNVNSDEVFDVEGNIDHKLDFILSNSTHHSDFDKAKKIVVLTTCKEPGSTERTILACTIEN